jgi:hypothetical protein
MRHIVIVTVAAGCVPDAPATPSFQEHVLPILAANCVRCHGYPAIGGGPASLRLDSYSDVEVGPGLLVAGAATYAPVIAERVLGTSPDLGPMPPRFPLDEHQVETIVRWAQVPPGETPPRGAPRPGNRRPEIALLRFERSPASIAIEARVGDADRDLVAGELRANIAGVEQVVGGVRSGTVTVHWNTTGIPPGIYPLAARLDDGAGEYRVPLDPIEVTP